MVEILAAGARGTAMGGRPDALSGCIYSNSLTKSFDQNLISQPGNLLKNSGTRRRIPVANMKGTFRKFAVKGVSRKVGLCDEAAGDGQPPGRRSCVFEI